MFVSPFADLINAPAEGLFGRHQIEFSPLNFMAIRDFRVTDHDKLIMIKVQYSSSNSDGLYMMGLMSDIRQRRFRPMVNE
jgi:hypothetical protein